VLLFIGSSITGRVIIMGFVHIYHVSVCGKENKEHFSVHYTGTEADVARFILAYLRDGFKVEIYREV
jgi:hypothetical protein